MSRYQKSNLHFIHTLNSEVSSWPDSRWIGKIDNCDVCSRPMAGERFMIDGPASTAPNPLWGNLCVVCAYKYSPVIKWGKAQLYEQREKGIWSLVSGGPEIEDDD